MSTHSEVVLKTIQKHPAGLDDDEISKVTGIRPRQQVHQICSRLAAAGEIRRESILRKGKRRKIHNFPADPRKILSIAMPAVADAPLLKWQRRLAGLIAATGKQEDEILDQALRDFAVTILKGEEKSAAQ